jgi:hypothetical protein
MAKPRDENLVIKLWHQLTANNVFIQHLSKFMQFVELTIVQVIGSVKDERTFSTSTFMKSKLGNQLARHLDIVIRMFAQDFFTRKLFLSNLLLCIGMMETRLG